MPRRARRLRGSASAPAGSEPDFFVVGRVLRPHGLRGEVRIALETDHPERLQPPLTLYFGPMRIAYAIAGVRFDRGEMLLKLEGVDSRTEAEALRGLEVAILAEEAAPLQPGEYYVHQIIGLEVWTKGGRHLGQVVEVLETGANDVYVVHGPGGEVLIPAIRDVVMGIDLPGGRMVIRPLEGLL